MSFDCKRITRRRLLQGVGVLIAQSAVASKRADAGYFDEDASTGSATWRNEDVEYGKDTLPLDGGNRWRSRKLN